MLAPVLSRHRDTDDAKAASTEAAPPYSIPTTVTYLGSIAKWGSEAGTYVIASNVTFNSGDYVVLLLCLHDGTSYNTSPTDFPPSGPWSFGTPTDYSAPATADASRYYIISHVRLIPVTSTATGDLSVTTPSTVYGAVVHAYKIEGGNNIVIDTATFTGPESNGTSLSWTNGADQGSPYLAAISTTNIGDSTPWKPTGSTIDNTSAVGSVIEGRGCSGTLSSGQTSITMDNANQGNSASAAMIIFKESTGGTGGGGGSPPPGSVPWDNWIASPTDTMGSKEIPAPSRIVNVTNTTELVNALKQAQPGDHIILENGTYGLVIVGTDIPNNIAGTATAPIVIRAKNLLGANWFGLRCADSYTVSNMMIYGINLTKLNWMRLSGEYVTIRRCIIEPLEPYIAPYGYIKFAYGIVSKTGSTSPKGLRYFRADHCIFRMKPPSFTEDLVAAGGTLPLSGEGRYYTPLIGNWDRQTDFNTNNHDEYWVVWKCLFEGGVNRTHYSTPGVYQFSKAGNVVILNHSDYTNTPSNNFYFGKCFFRNGGWPLDVNTKIRKSWWDRCHFSNMSSWAQRNGLYWLLTRCNCGLQVEVYTRRLFYYGCYFERLLLSGSQVTPGMTYEDFATDAGTQFAWFYGARQMNLHHCNIGTFAIGSTNFPYPPEEINLYACSVSVYDVRNSSNGTAPSYTESATSTYPSASPISLTDQDVGPYSQWETPPGFATLDNVDWSQLVPTTGVP